MISKIKSNSPKLFPIENRLRLWLFFLGTIAFSIILTGIGTAIAAPTIAINDVSVNEGDGTASFTVTLSEAGTTAIQVKYSTADNTANAGSDYTAIEPTNLTWSAGNNADKTVTVTIADGNIVEATETFYVNLTDPTGNNTGVLATIGDSQGVGTIIDNDYTITPTTDISEGSGTIDPSSPVFVEEGGSASFDISPGEGYYFKKYIDSVLEQTSGLPDTHNFTNVNADHTIAVSFHANPTITPSAGSNGGISPNTVQTVNYGSNSTIFTMSPGDNYCVDTVTVTGGSQGEIYEYTFTDITADQTIGVTFRENYTFTGKIEPFMARAVWGGSGKWLLKKTDGTVITGELDHGDTVIIPCDINEFTFEIKDITGWTRVDADGSIAFTTPATAALTAEYKPNLTTSASGQGTVDPLVSNQAQTFNEIVTLAATPNSGYVFARWEGDVTGTDNPTSVTMSEPRTVTAVYVIASAADIDNDGDGFSENNGDCNDTDDTIYPGAVEVCGDNIDQDCTGADLPCVLEKVCLDISDVPLDTQLQAAPANIMFVIDDSGSMDWEFMTSESEGLFDGDRYIFDDPGNDNNYSGTLSASERAEWKSQWYEYNKMYYKPSVNYAKWPGLPDADPDNPKTDPTKSYTLGMGDTFLSFDESGVDVSCAGCVVVDDTDGGGGSRTIVRKDQQTNGGTWTKLGDFDFNAGSSTGDYTNTGARVVVTRESSIVSAGDGQFLLPTDSSSTSADAVKLIYTGGPTEYIADNGAAGWSSTGTWSNSSGPDSYVTTSYYSDSTGSKGIYDFTLATTGTYEVWARWTVAGTRPTNAPYTIYHANAGDPVKLFIPTGPWEEHSAGPSYLDHYLYTDTGDTVFTATWRAYQLDPAQEYDVYSQWYDTDSPDSRSADVLHTIYDTTEATDPTYSANHKINGGKWNKIASGLKFNGTSSTAGKVSGKVTLSHTPAASDSDRASADAVAFVPAGVVADPTIINAHYYVESSVDGKKYLIILDGSINYYWFDDDGDDVLEPGELKDENGSAGQKVSNAAAQTAGIIPASENSAVISSAGSTTDTTLDIDDLDAAPSTGTLFTIEGEATLYTIGAGSTTTELAFTPALSADAADGTAISFYRTYTEERQNFANWYSFYRRREFTAKAAISNVINGLKGVQVGFYSLWQRLNQPVLKVKVTQNGVYEDYTQDLLDDLYAMDADDGTPLRRALRSAGRYYHQDDNETGDIQADENPLTGNPWYPADSGGNCQQSFAIVITDGFWNGLSPNVDNQDSGKGQPYEDGYSNTLADVAMKYYSEDLADDLDNIVPTNFLDENQQQHMVTYGVSFGVTGTLIPDDYDLYNSDPAARDPITWPDPTTDDSAISDDIEDGEKIDDLWHASVNGRGYFLSAGDPEELVTVLSTVMQNVLSRIGSGASVSINGEELHAGTVMFQASYSTDGWTGDVKAYSVNTATGQVNTDTPIWSTSEVLGEGGNWDDTDWDSGRVIATYDNVNETGIAFRYSSLTTTQKNYLGAATDDAAAQDRLEYLRGSNENEEDNGGSLRNRDSKLGDIVHSSPLYINYEDGANTYGVLYVGGNDGMLHAVFAGADNADPDNGKELFAYVPNHVFSNMSNLTLPNFDHKFYVDLSPFVRDTGTETILVGGLGKGGKGYYALDVTSPKSITENDLSWVKWEFPTADTSSTYVDNMGYSFSRAFIVNSNATDVSWIVIFGNGYDSKNQCAALFVLDADSGQVVNLLETTTAADCSGDCNGLSTPVPVDVNGDLKVDYVYAGDLQGNIWKFDLTSANKNDWGSAYMDGSTPKPMFTATGTGGTVQPITVSPSIMKHPDHGQPGFLVDFGTGKYLHPNDFGATDTQTIYGIWDYGDDVDEYLGTFNRGATQELSNQPATVSLLAQTQIFFAEIDFGDFTRILRVLSDNTIVWDTIGDADSGQDPNPSSTSANNAGWYFDLPHTSGKERVVRDGLIRDGKYIVITSIPKDSPCAAGGDSIVHEMDAATGGRLDTAQFDINESALVDTGDLIFIPNPDFGVVDGAPETIQVAPTGIHFPAMMYPPVILRMPDEQTEMKYFSTAAGNITLIQEVAEDRGMTYWLEY